MAGSGKPSGSADSFIGSLISLTSKSEIRYEGVLYNIDTEDATIGLQNVRSYGTEGRRKDGPQILPNDRVFEYILFKGSDIKDLQVKSSLPVHTEQQIHNDPAIIQSHYARGPVVSSSAPIGGGALTELSSYGEPSGLPRPVYPGGLPSYQPGPHLGSWSSPATQNVDGASLAMPMYWHGYYGSSSGFPRAQQQPVPFHPPSTMPVPLTQNQSQYPEVQVSVSTSTTNLSERIALVPPPIDPTVNSLPLNSSSFTPANFSTSFPSGVSSSLSSKGSLPANLTSMTADLLAMPSLRSSNQDLNAIVAPTSGKSGSALIPGLPIQSLSYSAVPPTLLTPNQLTQSVPHAPSSTQKLYTKQKDMESLVPTSSKPSLIVSSTPVQVPLLPLPNSSQQLDESVGNSRPSNGERKQDHGQGSQHSVTDFTEEFDFIAMNEKFKKDEVWGYLGKGKQRNKAEGTEDNPIDQSEDDDDSYSQPPKFDANPVYVKDEFFDTLSCNSLTRGGRNGRTRFSERMKLDTETFGDFQPRPHLGRGGRGFGHGGNYRGSYNRGRGYSYGGRGRGGYMPM